MKKIIAINGSPRPQWNTAQLVREAARAAEAEGAEVKVYDLYKLEKFTGCISCFGCKLPEHLGTCVCRDGLTEILDEIRTADGLILGTPNYLGDISAGLRALYERLVFQTLSYKTEPRSYNDRKIPVLFIMTSNCSEEFYPQVGYEALLKKYENTLNGMVGPVKFLIADNTLQVNDYPKYNWTMFDPQAKKEHHEKHFPEKLREAFELGKNIVNNPWI